MSAKYRAKVARIRAMAEREPLTAKQIAERTGASVSAVQAIIKKHDIPVVRLSGASRQFTDADFCAS